MGEGYGQRAVRRMTGSALAAALVAASTALGGCSVREHICSAGHYPVKAVGNKSFAGKLTTRPHRQVRRHDGGEGRS
jgi:hypothetical protein